MMIDIHTHYVPSACLASMGGSGTGVRAVYDAGARLAAMDAQGVDLHVVCPPPVLFGYEAPPQPAAAACRRLNDGTAELCRRHPRRFAGLGTVPLGDVRQAVAEVSYCRRELGFPGVVLGTHVGPRYLDHPDFRPLLEAAAALDAFVLIHPRNPPGAEAMQDYYLGNTVGNPIDTTICIARLIHSGTLDALPDLRLCLAHGGGYLAFATPRLDHAWRHRTDLQSTGRMPPGEYLRRLYYDSCTHSAGLLSLLVAAVGADRVLMGSDAPQDMADPEPLTTLARAPGLSPSDRRLIGGANAAGLLGLSGA